MCLAIPGKIISLSDTDKAVVDFNGVQKEVNVGLTRAAVVGDYVIVHAGFAIQKMGEQEAMDVLKIVKKMPKHNHGKGEVCEH